MAGESLLPPTETRLGEPRGQRRPISWGRALRLQIGSALRVDDSACMHRVVIVALDNLVSFDPTVPCELFRSVRLADGTPGYRVRVCGAADEVDAVSFKMRLAYNLSELSRADTI